MVFLILNVVLILLIVLGSACDKCMTCDWGEGNVMEEQGSGSDPPEPSYLLNRGIYYPKYYGGGGGMSTWVKNEQ